MKISILTLIVMTTNIMWSQISEQNSIDTINLSLDAKYANQIYYSLQNGVEETVDLSSWHLAFETSSRGAAIKFNSALGNQLRMLSPVSEWSTLDTASLESYSLLYDSDTSWFTTAFNESATSTIDYGWGQYDGNTHNVNGDSIYVINYGDDYKKFYIEKLESGIYYLVYADLDGENEVTKQIVKEDFDTKNFVYFSFETEEILDLEPIKEDWDLVFTKYTGTLTSGTKYGVTGVLLNDGVTSANVTDGSTIEEIDNDDDLQMSPQINAIGYDWKKYTGVYTIADSNVFVIKDKNESVWNLEFLSFAGSSTGNFSFRVINQSDVTGIFNNNNINTNQMSIYPNPIQAGESAQISIQANDVSEYKIYNQQGDILFISTDKLSLENKTSQLTSGSYLITAETNTGSTTKRLMIY